MADNNKEERRINFRIYDDDIKKLDECIEYKKKQLKIINANLSLQDYFADLIRDDYYRMQGKTNDADTVNKINTFVNDSVNSKFGDMEDIRRSLVRITKMLDVILWSKPTQSERIKKRIEFSDYSISQEEALEEDEEFINQQLVEQSEMLNYIDNYIDSLNNEMDKNI